METILVKDIELIDAINELTKAVRSQSAELHQRSPMTDNDIYLYCNKRLAFHKITKAMRDGEIERCIYLGNKLVAQKQYVDKWLDDIFSMEKPGKAAGYEIIPIQHLQKLLKNT